MFFSCSSLQGFYFGSFLLAEEHFLPSHGLCLQSLSYISSSVASLTICIAGLNRQAGYATVYKSSFSFL